MAQHHPKHPGPSPLARGRVERGRPAEEIHLRLGPGGTVKDADGAPRRRQRPHKPFHRFVARAVPVFLDEVLPDPLHTQTGVTLLGDHGAIGGLRRTAGAVSSRGTFWPDLPGGPRRGR